MVAAVLDALDLERDELFKSATAFAGGIGMEGDGSCGAYIGGVLILGDHVGRTRADFRDADGVRFRTYALTKQFHDWFVAEFGSVTCREVQQRLFGRSYDLVVPEDFREFEAAGGHTDKCPQVVGNTASWIVEFLDREGLLGVESS
jgi:C_GCAxxG_C_C family probable redox protein